MNISFEPRRSFMEPTLPTWPWSPDCETTLLHAYSQLANAQTHQQFVTTCLRSNTIPWGLRINTRPQVPSPPNEAFLEQLHQTLVAIFVTSINRHAHGPKRILQEMWATSGTIHLNWKEQSCSVAREVEVRKDLWTRKGNIQSDKNKVLRRNIKES